MKAAAVQPSGFIRVSPRLYAFCAVAPASAKAKMIPAKMRKPAKTSNRPASELMSKLQPNCSDEKPCSGYLGRRMGEQGFLIRVQLLVDDELLKPIYSSALNGRQTIMANAALTSALGGKRTFGYVGSTQVGRSDFRNRIAHQLCRRIGFHRLSEIAPALKT